MSGWVTPRPVSIFLGLGQKLGQLATAFRKRSYMWKGSGAEVCRRALLV
jgi:hypothetical protein